MDNQGTLGGLIPLWILAAPFLLSFIELMRTPKVTAQSVRAAGHSGSGVGVGGGHNLQNPRTTSRS